MIRDTIFRKTEAVLRRPEGGFRFFAALRKKFAKSPLQNLSRVVY